jgi:hypothetical protein
MRQVEEGRHKACPYFGRTDYKTSLAEGAVFGLIDLHLSPAPLTKLLKTYGHGMTIMSTISPPTMALERPLEWIVDHCGSATAATQMHL